MTIFFLEQWYFWDFIESFYRDLYCVDKKMYHTRSKGVYISIWFLKLKCLEFRLWEHQLSEYYHSKLSIDIAFLKYLVFFPSIHKYYFLRYILWKERFNNNKTTMTSHRISIKKANKQKQNKNKENRARYMTLEIPG